MKLETVCTRDLVEQQMIMESLEDRVVLSAEAGDTEASPDAGALDQTAVEDSAAAFQGHWIWENGAWCWETITYEWWYEGGDWYYHDKATLDWSRSEATGLVPSSNPFTSTTDYQWVYYDSTWYYYDKIGYNWWRSTATGMESAPQGPYASEYDQQVEQWMLYYVNELRTSLGLGTFSVDSRLDVLADGHARNIATLGPGATMHDCPSAPAGWKTFYDRYDLLDGGYMSENTAWWPATGVSAQTMGEYLVDLWIGSSGHYNNMTASNVYYCGVGYQQGYGVMVHASITHGSYQVYA